MPKQRVTVDTHLNDHQTLVAQLWNEYQIALPKVEVQLLVGINKRTAAMTSHSHTRRSAGMQSSVFAATTLFFTGTLIAGSVEPLGFQNQELPMHRF